MRILFQGDSITDGNRYKSPESRWDLNHQIGHSYAYVIAGKLGFEHPCRYTFINRGVSGDSVDTIASRWQTDTLEEKPDLLSLLLGINGNSFEGVYPEGPEAHLTAFETKYRWLLESAREQNPSLKLVLIEPFALPVGQVKPHYDAFLKVFRRKQAIIRSIAEDFHAVFVPIQAELEEIAEKYASVTAGDPYACWLWDGIHPTEPLHWMIAQRWLSCAASLL